VAELLRLRAAEAMALNQRHLNPQIGNVVRTLGFDRDWAHGQGPYLIDRHGTRYLDLLTGYGVFAVGRNHPYVKRQLHRVLDADTASLPQIGVSRLAGVLAQRLVARAPARTDAVLLTNSGTESVEGAIKLARAATGRPGLVYCRHGFHGLTLGALSVNGNPEFRERFGSLLAGCTAIPFGDLPALERALASRDVAAFIVEPVQGKGVYPADDAYLRGAQRLCRDAGTLLVADEVQTGLGRTGRFLAVEHAGVAPDLITLSKSLSGGYVPVGAVLGRRDVFDATFDSMERSVVHGSTFGGGDLAAAAALATLDVIDAEQLVARSARLGDHLLELTRPFIDRFEIVRDVRGQGLMWAIELGPPQAGLARSVWDMVERHQPGLFAQTVVVPLFRDHRILIQVAGHGMNVIKALPALVVGEVELERFAAALESVLVAVEERTLRTLARLCGGLGRRRVAAR
jgi:ornithine--oxo-acid transaminase